MLAFVRFHEVRSSLATTYLVLAQFILLREVAMALHALETARTVLVADMRHQVVFDGEDLQSIKLKIISSFISPRYLGASQSKKIQKIQNKTLGHVISGQARFGTAQLHYFKLQAVRTESRYKRQCGYNSLLFTPFKTV